VVSSQIDDDDVSSLGDDEKRKGVAGLLGKLRSSKKKKSPLTEEDKEILGHLSQSKSPVSNKRSLTFSAPVRERRDVQGDLEATGNNDEESDEEDDYQPMTQAPFQVDDIEGGSSGEETEDPDEVEKQLQEEDMRKKAAVRSIRKEGAQRKSPPDEAELKRRADAEPPAEQKPNGGASRIRFHNSDSDSDEYENVYEQPPPQKRQKRIPFTDEEIQAIKDGVKRFGVGQWQKIKEHSGGRLNIRSGVQIKDKYRNMVRTNQI
jgi:hypothetical protein